MKIALITCYERSDDLHCRGCGLAFSFFIICVCDVFLKKGFSFMGQAIALPIIGLIGLTTGTAIIESAGNSSFNQRPSNRPPPRGPQWPHPYTADDIDRSEDYSEQRHKAAAATKMKP